MPRRAALRPCAGHRASCRARRIRRARALPVSPPPPPSPVAPRSAAPGARSPTAAEETDGAAARRRGSEPGESADPAHPARHPRETSSGAAGELRPLGREGPAPREAPTGAAPAAPLSPPHAPSRASDRPGPGAVGGRKLGSGEGGMVQGQGKGSPRTSGFQKSRGRSPLLPASLIHRTPQASWGCSIKDGCWVRFNPHFGFFFFFSVSVWRGLGGVSGRERDKLKGNRISLLVRTAKASTPLPRPAPVESSHEEPGISIFRPNRRRKAPDLEKKRRPI